MLTDAQIVALFKAHTSIREEDLARYTEPVLVPSETHGEPFQKLAWTADNKISLFLGVWTPTSKPQ